MRNRRQIIPYDPNDPNMVESSIVDEYIPYSPRTSKVVSVTRRTITFFGVSLAALLVLTLISVILMVTLWQKIDQWGAAAPQLTSPAATIAVTSAPSVTPQSAMPAPDVFATVSALNPQIQMDPCSTVVNVPSAPVYINPDTASSVLTTLSRGSLVSIVGRSADSRWLQIRVTGQNGWIGSLTLQMPAATCVISVVNP